MRQDFSLPTRDEDGQYPAYAWPGGYPLFYVDSIGNALCPACASKEDEYSEPTIACDTNWEDAWLYCDDCGKRIESAYAEDEHEDE